MRTGRPRSALELNGEERSALRGLAMGAEPLQQRARIVLSCDQGISNSEVAETLGVSRATVGKWRELFRVERVKGLTAEGRKGAPPRVKVAAIVEVVEKTIKVPCNGRPLSTRFLSQVTGLSQTTVSRIRRGFRLSSTSCVASGEVPGPVAGVFLGSPDRAIAFVIETAASAACSSSGQQRTATQPDAQLLPSELIAAYALQIPLSAPDPSRRRALRLRCRKQLVDFCQRIESVIPRTLKVQVVLDNDALRKRSRRRLPTEKRNWGRESQNLGSAETVRRWFTDHPRFVLKFLPDGAAWLNLASSTPENSGDGPASAATRALGDSLRVYNTQATSKPHPFIWVVEGSNWSRSEAGDRTDLSAGAKIPL
jgi:Homeodomain-like domain